MRVNPKFEIAAKEGIIGQADALPWGSHRRTNRMRAHKSDATVSRRRLLKQLACAPAILRAAPLCAGSSLALSHDSAQPSVGTAPVHDFRISPKYPSRSPLEDVLRLVPAGSDQYVTEKYVSETAWVLKQWGVHLQGGRYEELREWMSTDLRVPPFTWRVTRETKHGALRTETHAFLAEPAAPVSAIRATLQQWLGPAAKVERADFEITSIHMSSQGPLTATVTVRYDVLTGSPGIYRKQHIGHWSMDWQSRALSNEPHAWKLSRWQATSETVSVSTEPVFVDVTSHAFGDDAAFHQQLSAGSDYWRSVLDGACGIDIYGNNGIAAGDFDNDGMDDLYICQPAGLPNRLYKNRGDGTFEDVTYKAGVAVLDNTSCALFADFRNSGYQDLLVVCGSGPLLFLNAGDGTFRLKLDAFHFASTPQGTFTHAAAADYDLDGRLDLYLCTYSYYLGLDQYHYPVPYFDARNGPPNFLLRNMGDGKFVDTTESAGLTVDNNRYTFAAAWGNTTSATAPDLYVVNDFGRNVLYRNKGDGTFTTTSHDAKVEDVGAGMSACWADTANNGLCNLYAADMWSAAGQRVSEQPEFHPAASTETLALYRRHANGNAFYVNQGNGVFENASSRAGVDTGRWAWCSDFWDFDHDGYSDLYVTNGYITAPPRTAAQTGKETGKDAVDLGSFFWRQVVGRSPEDSTPSVAYERGWNAINELIRSDYSWSGSERNTMFANNRDGTFSDVSGVTGLDLLEDGRAFCLSDVDGDGRLEVIVKNRNAPQVRILHNNMRDLSESIGVRLVGTSSNRDAIGTSVRISVGHLSQKRFLQAGSGFLAQHSKQLIFGLGSEMGDVRATVQWPSGMQQNFVGLPRNSTVTFTEGVSSFTSTHFRDLPTISAHALQEPAAKQVPSADIETWLINPLRAPAFALSTAAGRFLTLESMRGTAVLLHFTADDQATSASTLEPLIRHRQAAGATGFHLLVASVNGQPAASRSDMPPQRSARLPGTTAFVGCTDAMLGVYNVIYRYLFDRRRDLPVPCSFLIDKEGMLVKLYQGRLPPETLLQDVKSLSGSTEENISRGLPFKGSLYQSAFMRNHFTYGVALFQHGYLNEAEASFQQVIASQPDDAEGHYNLGTLNLRQNNFAEARNYLRETLRLKPDYPEAWNNLGLLDAQEGKLQDAITEFQRCIQLRPTYATAYLNMGNAYRKVGDTVAAKSALLSALNLQADDPDTNYSLGLYYAQQGDVQPAETYLTRAVELRPDYAEALTNLGVLFVRRGDYNKAEQQFKRCVELRPDYELSYLNLARLYAMQHDPAKARDALQQLLARHPNSSAAQDAIRQLQRQ